MVQQKATIDGIESFTLDVWLALGPRALPVFGGVRKYLARGVSVNGGVRRLTDDDAPNTVHGGEGDWMGGRGLSDECGRCIVSMFVFGR